MDGKIIKGKVLSIDGKTAKVLDTGIHSLFID